MLGYLEFPEKCSHHKLLMISRREVANILASRQRVLRNRKGEIIGASRMKSRSWISSVPFSLFIDHSFDDSLLRLAFVDLTILVGSSQPGGNAFDKNELSSLADELPSSLAMQ